MNQFPSYDPFHPDELSQLERLIQQQNVAPQAPAVSAAPPVAAPPTIMPEPAAQPSPPPAPAPAPQLGTLPSSPSLQPTQSTTQGMTPEAQGTVLDLLGQARDQSQTATLGSRDAGLAGNQKLGDFYSQQAAQAEQERAAAAEKLAREEAARAKLEQSATDLSSRKENPAEAFGGMEWAGVLAAIGMAAGVFSQSMGWQQGNPVKDQFNEIINKSIASQREQKGSMLQTLENRIGDRKGAENMARAELNNAIARRVKAQEAQAMNDADRAKLAAIADERLAEGQKWYAHAVAEIAPKTSITEQRPKPVGGMSMVQRYNEAEATVKLGELSDLRMSPQRIGQIQARDKERNANIETLQKVITPLEDVRASLDQVALAANFEKAEDGSYRQKPGTDVPGLESSFRNTLLNKPLLQGIDPIKIGVPFTGVKTIVDPSWSKAMEDPATAKLVSAVQNSLDLVGRMRSGGAITEDEWSGISRIMLGTTGATFAQNMSQFNRFIEDKQRRALDQADDDTLIEFQRRRKR